MTTDWMDSPEYHEHRIAQLIAEAHLRDASADRMRREAKLLKARAEELLADARLEAARAACNREEAAWAHHKAAQARESRDSVSESC